jgi:hypothetical protein
MLAVPMRSRDYPLVYIETLVGKVSFLELYRREYEQLRAGCTAESLELY